jgi:hypothetical protein
VKRVASGWWFLALCLVLQAQTNGWDRINILCLVRDSQGRPLTNLTKDRFEIVDAGVSRAILEFSRPNDHPQIETIANGPNLYHDGYRAIWRTFGPTTNRKILVIDDRPPLGTAIGTTPSGLTSERRWELIFLAERRGVVIYLLANSSLAGTPLAAMAEETGGRVAASEHDIQADLAAQYHIVAEPPPHGPTAGAFHALEVRVGGLRVQAPHSFYITPPWAER